MHVQDDSEAACPAELDKAEGEACCGSFRTLARMPRSVFFISGNEFCERFSYYGFRAILVVYFSRWLSWSDDRATQMYNVFNMLYYAMAALGGALADSPLGKYRIIMAFSVVYAIGNLVMAVTAIPGATGTPPSGWGCILGLLLVAIGTGGIKPCVNAFGADQLDQRDPALMETYFALYYFIVNLGSISMFITPLVRANFSCFGVSECYPLAFGLPTILMIMAVVLFYMGRGLYQHHIPKRNIILDTVKAIYTGARCHVKDHWIEGNGGARRWLDYAEPTFGKDFIKQIRSLATVLLIFLPMPLYWTVYDQLGSRWTLQAEKMQLFSLGALGEFQPDMMQSANTVLLLLLIPVFQKAVYPFFARIGLAATPLRRMRVGMLLSALAFAVSGGVQIAVDRGTAVPMAPTGTSLLRCVNTLFVPATLPALNLTVAPDTIGTYMTVPNGMLTAQALIGEQALLVNTTLVGAAYTLYLVNNVTTPAVVIVQDQFTAFAQSSDSGYFQLFNALSYPVAVTGSGEDDSFAIRAGANSAVGFDGNSLLSGSHQLSVKVSPGVPNAAGQYPSAIDVDVIAGALYTVILFPDKAVVVQESDGNAVSILWQVPQYIIATCGEILFSITGFEFAYTEAPENMKAVLQAFWLMTTAFGSGIIIVILLIVNFSSDSAMLFAFAVAIFAVFVLFTALTWNYRYRKLREEDAAGPTTTSETAALLGPAESN
eukprot:m.62122 g.62122  ORF g.62122 m.62122 type:complete len:715 (-) comp7121_c0_seq1:80-2224(-)